MGMGDECRDECIGVVASCLCVDPFWNLADDGGGSDLLLGRMRAGHEPRPEAIDEYNGLVRQASLPAKLCMSKSYPAPKELIRYLKPFDPAVRDLALATRQTVLEEMTPCVETVVDAYSAVAIGFGPSGKLSEDICHVATYTKGVNLGFNRGARMADPEGVLEGSG